MNDGINRREIAAALGKAELEIQKAQRRGDGLEVERLKQLTAELEVRGRALLETDANAAQ